MNILLMSTGGGGGNILRSVKALFNRDVAVTRKTDPVYAARLSAAVATRFLDTNEFSLSNIPVDERLLIGARTTGRLGARHNPDVAREALEESKSDVEALISQYSVVVVIGTGGKGTGAGTIYPLAQMARQQRKLVLPIFVRPSFERHEVDKRRYDHAVTVSHQFDRARIRLIEILNDRGYDEGDPQPQATVWERMNLPIARALRGMLYVLWDLSQVDPSDLSTLFAGHGRLRIGFGGIEPPHGREPSQQEVEQAVRECWDNRYYAFEKPAGTSLICIQGQWSNIVDAKIKGGLATAAITRARVSPYTPLYTRVSHAPRPWGVTALFSEDTGVHPPIDVEWSIDGPHGRIVDVPLVSIEPPAPAQPASPAQPAAIFAEDIVAPAILTQPKSDLEDDGPSTPAPSFASLWELAVAVNRSDPAALAVASHGAASAFPVDGGEVRKLLSTVWFRTVVPRMSGEWRARILDAFVNSVVLPNHTVKVGRQAVPMGELTYAQLREVATTAAITDSARPDLDLLLTIGRLWGDEAIRHVRFSVATPAQPLRLGGLLQGVRADSR